MINLESFNFNLYRDMQYLAEIEDMDIYEFSKSTSIAKNTIYSLRKGEKISPEIYEKFYSFAYKSGYRFNVVKNEVLSERNDLILYHGSKNGLGTVTHDGSRAICDLGAGFYLGQSFDNALAFVSEYETSSVYSLSLDTSNLKVVRLECNLDWLLIVCYFRHGLKEYQNSPIFLSTIEKIKEADVIIAPIADNRIFFLMSLFANGDINVDVALSCLESASLGLQYVLKTDKAINNLKPIEKYYLCKQEKENYSKFLANRANDIETKLNEAKRKYRNGLFIDEVLA